jgi:hypothetical protein
MRTRLTPLVLAATLAAVLAAGCGSQKSSSGETTTTAPPAPSTTAPGPDITKLALTIDRVVNGVIVPTSVHVPRTQAVAAASLKALGIDAPVKIAGGTATVDFPNPTPAQTAEIVFTLTRFPTIQQVDVGGRSGHTRNDVASFAPIIFVEDPASDERLPPTIRVAGSAVVFEGTLVDELHQNGEIVQTETVTASAGAPERGRFGTDLHATSPGPATVVIYAPSAADGSHQHQVTIPVVIEA